MRLEPKIVTDATAQGVVTAATVLLTTPQPGDEGAATSDRYDWQAMMATADLLAAYLDLLAEDGTVIQGAHVELICEHHEDWALSNGRDAEIVSAKHKETQFGAFTTLRALLDDGGVLHLFERWKALQHFPSCRLVTTAGLTADCRDLIQAAEDFRRLPEGSADLARWDDLLSKFSTAIDDLRAKKHGLKDKNARPASETKETLIAFLQSLRVHDSRPPRNYLPLMAPAAYAKAIADRLGSPTGAEAIWTAVLQIVRERMRAAGPTSRGSLPRVLGASDEADYDARTLRLDELSIIITVAVRNPSGYRPLPRRVRVSAVAVKMVRGGCSDNAIERAEELRRQYRRYWRDRTSMPSTKATQQRLVNVLHRIIDEATTEVSRPGTEWGAALWQRLQQELDLLATSDRFDGLDSDLLLGGVCDLSNQCKAWFSERFDAVEAARQLAEAAS